MKIQELKQGDLITQHIDNLVVSFEVLSIQQIGRRFQITFSSASGIATASYQADALITTI
ncbi:hypothetical protein KIF53_21645 [Chromobacterium subtsugae]|uniref:Uncharacterized protein n=1 Tax=Chromobacterium subtsugae TaxID=251747 RepID=A0ABS7FJK9_9NEIS|nr:MULTISPECIES: hypothetical protein [Chromobacterium]KUM04876.1 hypothetical protein Cv017_12110 [Chromobacterium subtsugae]KZE85883.1 hypothetical protein AWB61_18530 [Chromobacterium sp. F49]MBW7569158.1 hypothetical protein [Chromobacterium subtsugae]MBW8290247.1 hypothetical protein [Chromobacterium subtsugae]OBU84595.1 hypothetical protein MY55_21115 [Chromobacterium subtsugae]